MRLIRMTLFKRGVYRMKKFSGNLRAVFFLITGPLVILETANAVNNLEVVRTVKLPNTFGGMLAPAGSKKQIATPHTEEDEVERDVGRLFIMTFNRLTDEEKRDLHHLMQSGLRRYYTELTQSLDHNKHEPKEG